MSEPVSFQIVRQMATRHRVPFAEVEAALYGEVTPTVTDLGRRALVKNGLVSGCEPPRVSPLQRRRLLGREMAAQVEGLYPITDEVHAEYAYVFDERVSVYVYEGMPERCGSKSISSDCCAQHRTLTEVGCVEFYDWQERFPFDASVLPPIPTPAPVGHCSRCESVGHVVRACPFSPGDVDVMKGARLRRERRAGRVAAA